MASDNPVIDICDIEEFDMITWTQGLSAKESGDAKSSNPHSEGTLYFHSWNDGFESIIETSGPELEKLPF